MNEELEPQEPVLALGFAAQLIFLLAAIAILGGFVAIRRYTNENPRFCESCHEVAPEVRMWLESEHSDIRCQACHHQTMGEGLEILWVYLLGEMPDIQHAEVSVHSCAECHASHDPDWPQISNSSGHLAHSTTDGLNCTECHGQQMHFGQPAREVCLRCHEGKDTGAAHELDHCLACHNYLSTEQPLLPGQRACMRCHMKQDRPIKLPPTAPMHFVCAGCHEPHADGRIVACADCHRPSEICGLHDHSDHRVCGDCHESHEWAARDRHCNACHTELVEHYPDKQCASCHAFEDETCDAGTVRGPPT